MQTYRPRWRFLKVYRPSFLGLTDNVHYVVLSLPLFQYALKKNIPPHLAKFCAHIRKAPVD